MPGDLAASNRVNQAAAAGDRTRERPHYPSKRTGWSVASVAGLCQQRSFRRPRLNGSSRPFLGHSTSHSERLFLLDIVEKLLFPAVDAPCSHSPRKQHSNEINGLLDKASLKRS
jgi:hypothetical protein